MRRFLLCLVFLAACNGDTEEEPPEPHPTLDEVCDALVQTTCYRGVDCRDASLAEVDACVETLRPDCCNGAACHEEVEETYDEVNACIEDIGTMSCASWESGYVPPTCQ